MPSPARPVPRRWDLFCRVVDNLGDAGVTWRLARQLAAEHALEPRLWIDAPAALARLAAGARPGAVADGVRVEHWRDDDPRLARPAPDEVAPVLVAAFGCALPPGLRAALRTARPVWVNLEYLSAEAWIDTHHGLPSPKPDGAVEHFFFPGFGAATGGLPRERGLLARRDAFAADAGARRAFLASIGVAARDDERLASLFCYPDTPVGTLLAALDANARATGLRWRLLVPEGVDAPPGTGAAAVQRVPFLPQDAYDRLLWSCALNLVRGEDSWMRALWAGRPLLWQAYRQPERAHDPKLEAFVARWLDEPTLPAPAARACLAAHRAWNLAPEPGAAAAVAAALPAMLDALPGLAVHAGRASGRLAAFPDLAASLVAFVGDRL